MAAAAAKRNRSSGHRRRRTPRQHPAASRSIAPASANAMAGRTHPPPTFSHATAS